VNILFYDLFSNITIVVAFLFVFGQVFRRHPMNNKSSLKVRVFQGVYLGCLGVVLMLYTINVTSTIIVDLRNTAIMSAAVIGGTVPAIIAAIIIAAYRILYFGISEASIVAFLIAMLLGVGCAVVSSLVFNRLKRFLYMLLYALVISTAAFAYLLSDVQRLFSVLSYYIPISVFGVILAYFAIEYINSRGVMERKLEQSNEEISDILESIQDAFFTLDENWRFTYANREFARIVSLNSESQENVLGKCIYEVFPSEQYSNFYGDFEKAMFEKIPVYFEGNSRVTNSWYYISIYPKKKGISVSFRDITKQKEISELLVQRSEEAIKANEYKSKFLATMSHELRTPLNSIIGFTNRVIKKCGDMLPKTHFENLEIVRNEAQHLLELINNLLDYSKIEAGKMEVYPEEFDLREVIEQVSIMTNTFAECKHLNYTLKLPAIGDILIFSDKLKIKQILTNLLSNAFKYSESGEVTVSVAIEDRFYRIDVQDEGIGILEEHMEKIFDEFLQIDATQTRKEGGTGLGLSIAKKFAEMLGGRIEAHSKLGEGSKFTVFIPIRYSNI
jgi:PAS domain S-box-containing protein